jgi:4-carboxymuconolactone decarboxylase
MVVEWRGGRQRISGRAGPRFAASRHEQAKPGIEPGSELNPFRRNKRPGMAGARLSPRRDVTRRPLPAISNRRPSATPRSIKESLSMPRKRPTPRLPAIAEANMSPAQRRLRDNIASGPRGRLIMNGPFGCFLHAPEYGDVAQALGAFVRFKTTLAPRLSEFAILTTARLWRAQYEWHAHAPMAERAGVKPETIRALRAGRRPARAPADERALYDFIRELYRTRRVSDATYRRVNKLLGDAGTVELVGILGYYSLISMTLNVFRAAIPDDAPLPFAEP